MQHGDLPTGRREAERHCRRHFARQLALESDLAEEISLPQFDAVVTQDVVRRGGVEIETRQREIAQVPLAAEGNGLPGSNVDGDVSRFRAVELGAFECSHIRNGVPDALLQLGEGRFGVGSDRNFNLCEACAGSPRQIAGVLDLEGERKHVGKQPRAEQGIRLNSSGPRVRFGLVENRGKTGQGLNKRRH